jgi:hypothetical protein
MVFVLQSASFTFSVPKRPHVCLVSSQSFPHLWKKLWKITEFDDSSLFWADFSPIRRGRNLEKPPNWGSAGLDHCRSLEMATLARAKLRRRPFFLKK